MSKARHRRNTPARYAFAAEFTLEPREHLGGTSKQVLERIGRDLHWHWHRDHSRAGRVGLEVPWLTHRDAEKPAAGQVSYIGA